MKKYFVASCSFGKDSLCMVLKLLELKYCLDEIIFFDFGMEFDAIYNNKEKFKKYLEDYNKENNSNIIFTELKSPINFYKGFSEIDVTRRKKEYQGMNKGYSWCGMFMRWGTALKVKTIKEHLKEHIENGILFQYIGLAVDEPKRIIKVRQERKDKVYLILIKQKENMNINKRNRKSRMDLTDYEKNSKERLIEMKLFFLKECIDLFKRRNNYKDKNPIYDRFYLYKNTYNYIKNCMKRLKKNKEKTRIYLQLELF